MYMYMYIYIYIYIYMSVIQVAKQQCLFVMPCLTNC